MTVPTSPARRRGALVVAVVAALSLALAACGNDDDSGAGGDPLSEQDQQQLRDRLDQIGTVQLQESGSVVGGGYGYSPADGFVTGYPSDWQTPLERCQAIADAAGELDGPPSTVPIQIIDNNDGRTYDVLASGPGGGTCEEQ